MVSFPNAKINLGLDIIEKRPDGFHNIESCFYPVQWCDALEIIPSEKLTFNSSGIEIPGNLESNLCLKAYNVLKKDFDLPPVNIHLLKNIPIGAGMGGGSSDAAFTIKTLNELFELNLSSIQIEDYIRPVGSDCAFFVNNQPVIAYKKGDEFEQVNLRLKNHSISIVYPQLNISTKEAYSGVVPKKPLHTIKDIIQGDIHDWKELLKNDFETSLFPKYPLLKDIKETLYLAGAIYASMTGSGSAVYGIFSEKKSVRSLFSKEYNVWEGTLEH